jgi:hypothetical protein
VLSSKLFTGEGIDDSTRQRLEGCALGGNETLTHIAHGQRGQHVRRVQEALSRIRESDPSLGIPSFSVNGVYDPAFAHAVYVYKQRRSILNYRGQIDDIVGTKTIRSLDLDLQPAKPKVQPSPTPPMPKKPGVFPKPDGPGCVKDENCPTSQSFTVQVLTIVTAGEFLEGAVAQFRFRNTQNLLTADYEWTAFGVGPPGPPLKANTGWRGSTQRKSQALDHVPICAGGISWTKPPSGVVRDFEGCRAVGPGQQPDQRGRPINCAIPDEAWKQCDYTRS